MGSKHLHMTYMCRVVAKKIVSRFEIFISRSPFFARDLEQNSSQSFPMPGMRGYPGATKLPVNLQDAGRSTRKENTINKHALKTVFFFQLLYSLEWRRYSRWSEIYSKLFI